MPMPNNCEFVVEDQGGGGLFKGLEFSPPFGGERTALVLCFVFWISMKVLKSNIKLMELP